MQINATRARYEKLGCICVEFRTYYMNHQSEIGIEIKKARLKGHCQIECNTENRSN